VTWGEFKALVEAQGVKDSDDIFYIDVHAPTADTIDVKRGVDGSVLIQEDPNK
jgi:hypothetical protein